MKSSTRSGRPGASRPKSGPPSPTPVSPPGGGSDMELIAFTGSSVPIFDSKSPALHVLLRPGAKPPPPELALAWACVSPRPETPTLK